MYNPFISVVIPTYNYGHFISETISSVLSQTYTNFEIVVVDDGSTDNTKLIIEKFKSKVKYVYQNNSGTASARNLGIRNATGDYVAFLDSDDLWLPEKLNHQVSLVRRHPDAGLIFSKCYLFDNESRAIIGIDPKSYYKEGKVLKELYLHRFIPSPTPLVKKEVFEKVGYFNSDFDTKEDTEMWLRIAAKYEIFIVPIPLAMYRIHPSTQTSKGFEKHERVEMAVIKSAADNNKILSKYYNLKVALYQEELGKYLIKNGKRIEGFGRLKTSLKSKPTRLSIYINILIFLLGPKFTQERTRKAKYFYYNGRYSLFNGDKGRARKELIKSIKLDPVTNINVYLALLLTFTSNKIIKLLGNKIGANRYINTPRLDTDSGLNHY